MSNSLQQVFYHQHPQESFLDLTTYSKRAQSIGRRTTYNTVEQRPATAHLNMTSQYNTVEPDEYERAISFNIIKTHQTIQRVEKDFEEKLRHEKTRYREKEIDNKHTIKALARQLDQEKDRRLTDLTNFADLKKKNIELNKLIYGQAVCVGLRKQMSDLIYENKQLSQISQTSANQVQGLQKAMEQYMQQGQSQHHHIQMLQQKLHKKVLKREALIDELKETHAKDIRRLQRELGHLQQANRDLEVEVLNLRKQGCPANEDRVKSLLLDLERESKKHIEEVNALHEHYRPYVGQARDLEERFKTVFADQEQLRASERALKVENTRLKLQNEQLNRRLVGKTIDMNDDQFFERLDMCKASPNQHRTGGQQLNFSSSRRGQASKEEEVLSNLVDNIQGNTALLNGHIRRKFSLENVLFRGGKLINKNQMMEELSEYDNLIKAMGALFYTSKRMGEAVPCAFQSWKEYAFECKARRIRHLLTQEKQGTFETSNTQQHPFVETRDFSQRMILKGLSSATGGDLEGALGSQGMTIEQHRFTQNELAGMHRDQLEEEEEMRDAAGDTDFDLGNHNEEYMRVLHSGGQRDSYSIIPFNNVQAHNPDSQYYEEEECEGDISIEENKRTIPSRPSVQQQLQEEGGDENDPSMQNKRLLEKYAQMLGANNGGDEEQWEEEMGEHNLQGQDYGEEEDDYEYDEQQ